jgi:heme exporter protein C
MKQLGTLILVLAMAALTVATMTVADIDTFQNPQLARIVFWHLPCAFVSTTFLVVAARGAYKFLKTRDLDWDQKALAGAEATTLMGALTLITGIVFSKVQWGDWWSWDPRQTSFLLVMLILGAYFALRSAFSDAKIRAANSAAYLLASILPVMFLTFVLPRILDSLHPDVVRKGGFDSEYLAVLLAMYALLTVITTWLYKMRVGVGRLELKIDAELANRDRPSASRVVRVGSVPDKH